MSRATFWFVAIFIFACAGTANAAPGVFQSIERVAAPADSWHIYIQPKWQRVLKDEANAPGFTEDGRNFRSVDRSTWKNLAAHAKRCSELETLRMVNGYFNQWRPKNDADTWDTPEYWAAPKEFFAQRGGDCEDYAIAKYFALRFLGIPADRMRVVIVRHFDETGKAHPQLHAVLTVFANTVWFVLDNNARPKNNIFPDTQYKGRFVPVYAINETHAWSYSSPNAAKSMP